jgi:uncharacterized protein YbcI
VSTEPRATSGSQRQPQSASNDPRNPSHPQQQDDGFAGELPTQDPSDCSDSSRPAARSLGADQSLPKGGELNAAITSALVGIHTEYLGRGPRRASTFHYGNVLVTLMHDVLTPAEKSLTRTNQTEAVNHIRHLFQETMAADFREAVERLTGRKLLAFISGNHLDPDIAAELFILDGPP